MQFELKRKQERASKLVGQRVKETFYSVHLDVLVLASPLGVVVGDPDFPTILHIAPPHPAARPTDRTPPALARTHTAPQTQQCSSHTLAVPCTHTEHTGKGKVEGQGWSNGPTENQGVSHRAPRRWLRE